MKLLSKTNLCIFFFDLYRFKENQTLKNLLESQPKFLVWLERVCSVLFFSFCFFFSLGSSLLAWLYGGKARHGDPLPSRHLGE